MKNVQIRLFAIIILLVVTALSASAAKKRVAILDFKAENTSNTYARAVRNLFEVALHKTGIVDILERNQIETILREQGFSMTGCTDESCAVQIGKLLSADMVVMGNLNKLGQYAITVKFVDVGKGAIQFAESESAQNDNALKSAVDRLANNVAEKIRESGLPEGQRAMLRRRIGLSLRGDYTYPAGDFNGVVKPGYSGGFFGEYMVWGSGETGILTVAGATYLSHDEDTDASEPKELSLYCGWGGAGYRYAFTERFALQLNVLGGYAQTKVEGGDVSVTSNDPGLMGDLEFRYFFYKGLYISLHGSYMRVFYTGGDYTGYLGGLGAGMNF